MNQPLKLIEERHKRGVTYFSSLFSRLSCTYCYLLQDIFTAEMALLHFSVPLIHRPLLGLNGVVSRGQASCSLEGVSARKPSGVAPGGASGAFLALGVLTPVVGLPPRDDRVIRLAALSPSVVSAQAVHHRVSRPNVTPHRWGETLRCLGLDEAPRPRPGARARADRRQALEPSERPGEAVALL